MSPLKSEEGRRDGQGMGAGLGREREVGRGGGGGGGGDGSDSLCDGIDLTPPLGHPAATLTLPQSLTSDPLTPPFSSSLPIMPFNSVPAAVAATTTATASVLMGPWKCSSIVLCV